jgi:hypothetical protein
VDNPIVQALIQGWPVMLANPGVAATLLLVGAVAGFWFRGSLAKAAAEGLREQLQAKVDLLALNKAQSEDISAKHNDVSSRLAVAMTDIATLTHQVQSGASQGALTTTSASVTAHVADLNEANDYLGHTIATLNFHRKDDLSYLDLISDAARKAPTNPPAASPPSPRPPVSPIRR